MRPPIEAKRSGILEEVDNLADFVLGFVDAGDVGEGDGHLLQVDGACLFQRRHLAGDDAVHRQAGETEEEQSGSERAVGAGRRRLELG